jgi:four helix bundle protein
MGNFRKLRAWHAAERLAIDAHAVALKLYKRRAWKRSDQLDRAAQSVPYNIVEGSGHSSDREFARYVGYSIASASEVEGNAQLARDVGLISKDDYEMLVRDVVDVRMLLYGLLRKLRPDVNPEK